MLYSVLEFFQIFLKRNSFKSMCNLGLIVTGLQKPVPRFLHQPLKIISRLMNFKVQITTMGYGKIPGMVVCGQSGPCDHFCSGRFAPLITNRSVHFNINHRSTADSWNYRSAANRCGGQLKRSFQQRHLIPRSHSMLSLEDVHVVALFQNRSCFR